MTGLVGPTFPWEVPDDKVVGHVGTRVRFGAGGLRPVIAHQPDLELWPKEWPFAKFRAPPNLPATP